MSIFIWLLGCSPFHIYQKQLTKKLAKQGFVHQVHKDENYELSYWIKESGAKTPIVLLHGFGGSGAWTWQRSIRAVSNDRPVILPDLLWFGESSSTQKPGLKQQAIAMQTIVDIHDWQRFDLVGTSYGGFVALQFSLLNSNRIQKLILIDSPGPVFSLEDVQALNQRFDMEDPSGLFVPTEPEGIRNLLDICYHKSTPPIPKSILKTMWEETSFSKHHKEKRLLLQDLLASESQFVDVEWKVDSLIWGAYDEIFPIQEAHELSALTGAEIRVIEDTAHCPFVEKPKEFLDVFLPLLSE